MKDCSDANVDTFLCSTVTGVVAYLSQGRNPDLGVLAAAAQSSLMTLVTSSDKESTLWKTEKKLSWFRKIKWSADRGRLLMSSVWW